MGINKPVRGYYKEVKAMIYNPIFEEEQERKIEFTELKRAIKFRAKKEYLKRLINRVYRMFHTKHIEALAVVQPEETLITTNS